MAASIPEERKAFGGRLRATRLSLGYTQEQMAYALGINPARYNKYEIGRSEPPYDILGRIADVADADLNYLITGHERAGSSQTPIDRLVDLLPDMPMPAVVFDRERRLMAHNADWRDKFFPDQPKGLLKRGTPHEVLIRAWAHARDLTSPEIEALVQARLSASAPTEIQVRSTRFYFAETVDAQKRLILITDLPETKKLEVI